jgi:hypothetical protein
MTFKNIISFIFFPKKYIKSLVKLHKQNFMREYCDEENLLPINSTNDEDIFIVGFPKSGNTWMQNLIAATVFSIDAQFLSDTLTQDLIPDVHKKKYYKKYAEFAIFKSHNLPQKHYRKVIYIVRDGRDALVSYHHFNKKLDRHFSYDEMIDLSLGVIPCSWGEHVSAWVSNPFNAEILYVKYEDLLNDSLSVLKSICNFIGIERNDTELYKAIEGNKIDIMRDKAKRYGGLGQKKWRGSSGSEFFRKGESGDYKNYLSDEQIMAFNNKFKQQLLHFGYQL